MYSQALTLLRKCCESNNFYRYKLRKTIFPQDYIIGVNGEMGKLVKILKILKIVIIVGMFFLVVVNLFHHL